MFPALARVVVGPARWAICVAWLVLLAALFPVSGRIDAETQNDTESLLPVGAESADVARLLRERFESGETSPALLVYRTRGDEPFTAGQRRAIADVSAAVRDAPLVVAQDVREPFGRSAEYGLVSPDGRTAFVFAPVSLADRKEIPDAIAELRARGQIDGLDFHVTGPSALEGDYATSLESADLTLLIASVLLVVSLLLAIYRSPLMAVIPLTVIFVAYIIAIGLLTLLARAGLRVDSTSTSLLLVLMFGAGTDYCLLFVSRYQQVLREREDHRAALADALAMTGPAILASGLTVALALLAMLAATLQSTRLLGPVNAIGVLVAMGASLTFLPAALAMLGRRAFWPGQGRVAFQADASRQLMAEGRWTRVGRAVIDRPRRILAGSVALLAVCCIGVSLYDGMTNPVDLLRSDQDSVRGYEVLASGFDDGLLAPTTIVVARRGGPLSDADIGVVRAAIRGAGGATEIDGSVDRSRDGRHASFGVFFSDDPYGDAAFERIRRYRDVLEDLDRPGVSALVGDSTAQQVDYGDGASRDNGVVLPLALLVIGLVLAVLLRALVAPLYLILTVVLSYGATMGISVFVFAKVFGQDTIDPAVPTFAFIFLVALGVDYNIFLMSRVREEALEHGTRAGLLRAVGATGPVITSAGIVLAGTFSVLMTIPVVPLLQIGFAVALGVLIDTFIVRTLLVPAITSLLGERSWWPSRARTDSPPPIVSGVYRIPTQPAPGEMPASPR